MPSRLGPPSEQSSESLIRKRPGAPRWGPPSEQSSESLIRKRPGAPRWGRLAPSTSLLLAVATAWAGGCKSDRPERERAGSGAAPSEQAGRDPVTLIVAYGSEKKSWLEEQVRAFGESHAKTSSGRPIAIELRSMGSGEAVQEIVAGRLKPHVFSPASLAYIGLLNQAWQSRPGAAPGLGAGKPIAPDGEPVVLSPVVIAMWKPMAEALGWPGKELGWADLIRVAQNGRGWGALGHPEWGAFKLGHTHPEFSNSGLLSVLAEAYAGAGKTRGLSDVDVGQPATREFVTRVEETIVHYGKSTGFFADKMLERGPSYLSAAVLYENLVVESYSRKTDAPFPIVAIYPVEGTFWSDHPYSVLDAEWVGADERGAAQAFLTFLKARPAQERALALGFRPADPSIATAAPIDAAHGADAKQPQTVLEVPPAPVLERLLAAWREIKKPTAVTLVFDVSGSMKGRPLAEAKAGARAFLSALHDRDDVTLVFFNNQVMPPFGPVRVDKGRAELIERVEQTIAHGGTALYDAVAAAYDGALARQRAAPGRIHAVVVMTDGRDENSRSTLEQLSRRFNREDDPLKLFAIAYGQGADDSVLGAMAEAAQGTSLRGTADSIVQVYQDMAAFF
jgi:Ca-activated chloride channel homolog